MEKQPKPTVTSYTHHGTSDNSKEMKADIEQRTRAVAFELSTQVCQGACLHCRGRISRLTLSLYGSHAHKMVFRWAVLPVTEMPYFLPCPLSYCITTSVSLITWLHCILQLFCRNKNTKKLSKHQRDLKHLFSITHLLVFVDGNKADWRSQCMEQPVSVSLCSWPDPCNLWKMKRIHNSLHMKQVPFYAT